MGIGENDWLAQEYKREGRVISSEAARRLAKEHLLDCDGRRVKEDHSDHCAADELKRDSRRAERKTLPSPKTPSQSNRLTTTRPNSGHEVYKKKSNLVDILLRLLFNYK